MTFLKRTVILAGAASLISSAALAQQQLSPPNEPKNPAPPNQPVQTPSRPDLAREQREAERREAERRARSREQNRADQNRKTDPDKHSRLGVNEQQGGPMQPLTP